MSKVKVRPKCQKPQSPSLRNMHLTSTLIMMTPWSVDQGSSINILYWEAFERLRLDLKDLKPFKVSLVGFSGEQIQVKGYIMLKITFRE